MQFKKPSPDTIKTASMLVSGLAALLAAAASRNETRKIAEEVYDERMDQKMFEAVRPKNTVAPIGPNK